MFSDCSLNRDRIIFHIDVNSAYLSWTAVKLLQYGDDSVIDIREIPSVIGGSEENRHGKLFEIKYDIEKCKWILFKI